MARLRSLSSFRRDDRAGRSRPDAASEAKRPIVIDGTYERLDDDDRGH
ncbi:MAG: hypothetical protein WDN31_00290 [Hyphomicrobium sp.]